MKKLVVSCIVLTTIISACNQTPKDGDKNSNQSSTSDVKKDTTSSVYELGDSKYIQLVLDAKKSLEEGNVTNSADMFANTVTISTYDGISFSAPKDSVLMLADIKRDNYEKVMKTIDHIFSIKLKNDEETWVCTWCRVDRTAKNGKTETFFLNENWMFAKSGKCIRIEQFKQMPHKLMN